MTVNYSIIDNLCRQAQILNEDELKIFLSKLDPAAKEHLQTEIFNSLSHNINDGVEYCPHCGSIRVNKYGSFHGSQRYKCRDCKKTFTNTKNSMFFHFRKDYEQKFKKYIECMVNKLSLHRSEEVCDISYRCSFV
jgi:transposase-like protein